MPRNLSDAPSLSVASLPRKAVVMGFGTKLIVGRYPIADDATPSPHNSVVVDDGQVVRAVAFLQIPDGPLCIVSAGDSKYINVYNISSWKQNNPNTLQNSSDEDEAPDAPETGATASAAAAATASGEAAQRTKPEYWKPAFQYGPHTKRITSLATSPEGTIVFADKFGEVYRIRLSWSPSHTIEVDGDATKPAAFLLQHFSIISCLYLSGPVPRLEPVAASEERSGVACRRLFTCDKDRHARVSRYPEAYVVEQFLWSRSSAQSAVTCVTEIPYMEDAAVYDAAYYDTAARVNKQNKALNAPYSYYAVGTHAGEVHFWAAKNDVPATSDAETFRLIGTFRPRGTDGQPTDLGPVVGVTVLTSAMDRFGHPRHPRDCSRGVLVAYEQSTDVLYVPIYDNMGAHSMHPAMVSATRFTLDARPVAMVGSNVATAFVLKRNGHVSFVRLCDVAPPANGEPAKTCSFNANIHVEVRELSVKVPYLEERIQAVMCTPVDADGAAAGVSELEALDVCAVWRYEAVDPRTRRQGNGDDEDGESNDSGADDGESASAPAGKNGSKKKARVEA